MLQSNSVAILIDGCVFSYIKQEVVVIYSVYNCFFFCFFFVEMVHTESLPAKLNKDELIILALDYQEIQEITLHKDITKLESELCMARTATDSLKNQITVLGRQYCTDSQHSRRKHWRYLECQKVQNILIYQAMC